VDSENIAQLVSRWRDEIHTCPGTIDIEEAIKIYIPVLRRAVRDRRVHIYPFDNEVDQRL
jgi:hypothetical protein